VVVIDGYCLLNDAFGADKDEAVLFPLRPGEIRYRAIEEGSLSPSNYIICISDSLRSMVDKMKALNWTLHVIFDGLKPKAVINRPVSFGFVSYIINIQSLLF